MKTYHYTYMLDIKNPTDDRKYYIGVRSSKCDPNKDNYYGSSKHLTKWFKEHGKQDTIKTILAIWDTREEAVMHEMLLHDIFNVGHNKLFFNRSKQKTTGFDTTGMVSPWKGKSPSEESRLKMRLAKVGKPSSKRGATLSEEQKQKISETKKNNPYRHTEEHINKMKQEYAKIVTCPYCKKEGSGIVMRRFHFTNCKEHTVI